MTGTVLLTVDELWECIYAARMQERYWKLRRRLSKDESGIITTEQMTEKVQEAKALVKRLEDIAPEESF